MPVTSFEPPALDHHTPAWQNRSAVSPQFSPCASHPDARRPITIQDKQNSLDPPSAEVVYLLIIWSWFIIYGLASSLGSMVVQHYCSRLRAIGNQSRDPWVVVFVAFIVG